MSAGMRLPKQVVAGHALAFLISQAETKKAQEVLESRLKLIGKWGNPSRTEHVTAPGPIIDWMLATEQSKGVDRRAIVEAAIELWYDVWPGKKGAGSQSKAV